MRSFEVNVTSMRAKNTPKIPNDELSSLPIMYVHINFYLAHFENLCQCKNYLDHINMPKIVILNYWTCLFWHKTHTHKVFWLNLFRQRHFKTSSLRLWTSCFGAKYAHFKSIFWAVSWASYWTFLFYPVSSLCWNYLTIQNKNAILKCLV